MNSNIGAWFEGHQEEVWSVARKIWANPEVAYEEVASCRTLVQFMVQHGFTVETFSLMSTSGEPNGLKAVFGSGKPVIGILGELDALPDLSQDACSYQSGSGGPGHGCGHNLLGVGCAAAAAAVAAVMKQENLPGTVIYYGCPAEETISGKVLMAAKGLFNELDLCLTWHPGGGPGSLLEFAGTALTNIVYEFRGKTAHAADNAHMGRSALDAAELMNIAGQYLREHVTKDVSFHYVYKAAGVMPNIVPDYAAVNYYIRANSRDRCDEIVERITNNARGAALMTGTEMNIASSIGCYEFLINHRLNRVAYEALMKIPPIVYSEEDKEFAAELYRQVHGKAPADVNSLLRTDLIPPTGVTDTTDSGSTDVADVSHICPTINTFGFGIVGKMPGHHWAVTACSGTEIGKKGMIYSAKGLAQIGYDILKNPSIVEECWAEFEKSREGLHPYYSHV